MDITTSAAGAVSPETTTISPATPAATAPSADTAVTPQTETPAGQDVEQQTAPKDETEALEKKPTPAEDARKQRNRERWQQMKQAALDSQRRERFYLSEIERLAKQQPDYSKVTDPNELLIEKTADRLRQSQIEEHRVHGQAAQAAHQQAVSEAWNAIADDMRARVPDFDQVVTDRTPIHTRAAPFIVDSEKGGEIAYWLGKNHDAAADLYRKFETNPAQAYIELGRIEARLSAPAPKQVSTAPKPAPVLSGGVNPQGFDIAKAGVSDVAAELKKLGLIR